MDDTIDLEPLWEAIDNLRSKAFDRISDLEREVDNAKSDIWRLQDQVSSLESQIRNLEYKTRC